MKILAVLTSAASVPATLDAAALAAAALADASIEALEVVVEPGHMMASSEEVSIQQLRELKEGTPQARARAVRTAFDAWTAGRDPQATSVFWRSVTGAETDGVVREAGPDVALLVVSHDANMDASDALHAAIFSTGKPVMLVPPTWRAKGRARFAHIAVGLIDDDTMRHAILAAEPWLGAATWISAISIEGSRHVSADPAAMWPVSTITPHFLLVPPTDAPTATRLVQEADRLNADLLVAGAYGHMELMEWLFGGVTRELLQVADLPVLFAH